MTEEIKQGIEFLSKSLERAIDEIISCQEELCSEVEQEADKKITINIENIHIKQLKQLITLAKEQKVKFILNLENLFVVKDSEVQKSKIGDEFILND